MVAWPKYLAKPDQIHSDFTLLLLITALVLLITIFFGSIPVMQILRQSTERVKLDARVNTETRDRRFARSALLITEIAAATLLVSAAANMAFYFSKLLHADPGMNPDHVLSVSISLSPLHYANEADRRRFLENLTEKLRGLPGIKEVAAASDAPFAGFTQTGDFEYEGEPNNIASQLPFAENYFVSPGYFSVMQVAILSGRQFSSTDKSDSPHVAIINKKMATALWPHQSAVGKRIKLRGEWQQIIGVVQDVHAAGVSKPVEFQAYLPTQQYPPGSFHLLLRTWTAPLNSAAAVKSAVYELDPQQPVSNVSDVVQLAANSIAGQNTATKMSGILGTLALLLASVGVYGVTAYSVSRRSREFGLRMALGAQRHDILHLLMKETSHLLLAGILLGGILAILLNHWLLALLPITTGYHAIAFTVTSLVLGSLVYLAALIPARRATSVDLIQVLKAE
jgi:putative ABC transport system permease protein